MRKALLLYGVLLVLMTAGMIAITIRLLTLERQEQISALRAENERLALWRIDSQLLPIVLRESSRDYSDELFLDEAETDLPPEVLCFFRGNASGPILFAGKPESDRRFLDMIRKTQAGEALVANQNDAVLQHQDTELGLMGATAAASQQAARSQNEFANRSRNSLQNSIVFRDQSQYGMAVSRTRVIEPMHAFWVDDRLFLARTTSAGKLQSAEGCRLDWMHLKALLLQQVEDLLPTADLVPLLEPQTSDYHAIANLPLRLIPGEPDLRQLVVTSALMPTLSIAWACFLASALALGGLLVGTIRLSERRAAFASAVTHELRTPLTTFRLYCDLLVDRTKLTDEKHSRYVTTLRNEAERLHHLIENVLSWSRLERSAEMELTETIEWTEFLDRVEPSMRERVQQAGMVLHVERLAGQTIGFRGNRTSVERVLFNLVDNACKYAKSAGDKRIELGIASLSEKGSKTKQSFVSIHVRDHGPGIASDMRRRLFRPFAKSAAEAATSAPGIGLGLSLSRRLARDMGGDLRLVETSNAGTTFELRLPLVNALVIESLVTTLAVTSQPAA